MPKFATVSEKQCHNQGINKAIKFPDYALNMYVVRKSAN